MVMRFSHPLNTTVSNFSKLKEKGEELLLPAVLQRGHTNPICVTLNLVKIVIAVYKNGMREEPGNYKPVNLTSVPRKIMEKFILGALERCLKDNAVISHNHHRLTKGTFN